MNAPGLTAALAATFAAGIADLAILNLAIAPAALGAPETDASAVAASRDEATPTAPSLAAPPQQDTEVEEPIAGEAERIEFHIQFATASAALRDEARSTLRVVARRMNAQPDLELAIRGHADRRGTAAANERVSALRSESAAAYLEDAGVDRTRMTLHAYGARRPLSRGSDPASLAQNRRVELEL